MPPRRLEYGLLRLSRRKSVPETRKMDKQFNYLVTNHKDTPIAIILNRYKTDKKYGTFEIDLTQPNSSLFNYSNIVKLGKKFIQTGDDGNTIVHNELLFPNTLGNVYGNFGERIKDLFKQTKKNISCDILRHSFITNFLNTNNLNTTSTKTLEKLSTAMGHSSAMFLSYRKIDSERAIEDFNEKEDEGSE
jgi:integrase